MGSRKDRLFRKRVKLGDREVEEMLRYVHDGRKEGGEDAEPENGRMAMLLSAADVKRLEEGDFMIFPAVAIVQQKIVSLKRTAEKPRTAMKGQSPTPGERVEWFGEKIGYKPSKIT